MHDAPQDTSAIFIREALEYSEERAQLSFIDPESPQLFEQTVQGSPISVLGTERGDVGKDGWGGSHGWLALRRRAVQCPTANAQR